MHWLRSVALVWAVISTETFARPGLLKRDAPFAEVRTLLDRTFSDLEPNRPDKYFHESTFHIHYDGRFADRALKYDQRQFYLRALIQTYLSTMDDLGLETFIMHGTLLGWWWNRSILPWDADLDVIITEQSLHHLASYYNMTTHRYTLPDEKYGRDYLLEINPHCWSDSVESLNKIDARWIDMENGLFIDITTLRRNRSAEAAGVDGAMMIKDGHRFLFDDIFPLRESEFEGAPVQVPFAYSELLREEYGPEALTSTIYMNHRFDSHRKAWVPLTWVDPDADQEPLRDGRLTAEGNANSIGV